MRNWKTLQDDIMTAKLSEIKKNIARNVSTVCQLYPSMYQGYPNKSRTMVNWSFRDEDVSHHQSGKMDRFMRISRFENE